MWTLVVCLAVGCPAIDGPRVIVIDGFRNPTDCLYLGQLNVEHVNPKAVYRCDKTNRPPVRCLPDTRTYGRTGECIVGQSA